MIKLDFYDQIFLYLVKNKILKDNVLYFNDNIELKNFIYIRYNISNSQIDINKNKIHLTNKLGERFTTIGEIIN